MTTPRHAPGLPPGAGAALPEMCPPARDAFLASQGAGAIARAALHSALRGPGTRPAPGPAGHHAPRYGFARVLAVIPGHLGDAIVATPALVRLRAALPDAWIVALAGPWGRDVLDRLDEVSAIIECRFPAFDRARAGDGGGGLPGRVMRLASRAILAEALRRRTAASLRGKFDAAVILAADFPWGTSMVEVAGVPVRAGMATPGAAPYLTHGIDTGGPAPVGAWGRATPRRHVAAQMIEVADAALGALGVASPGTAPRTLRYDAREDDRDQAARAWADAGLDECAAVIAIHPVPGAAVKRWAPARWAAVIDAIHARYAARVILTGTAGDAAEVRAIAGACAVAPGPVDLAGRLTFGALGALLDRVRLAAGPDGGTIHLAAARGIPTVRLFGPTDAATWGAWTGVGDAAVAPADATAIDDERGVPAVHVSSPRRCAPCHRLDLPALPGGATYPCMDAIEVATVMRAIDAAWEASVPGA